MNEVAIQEIMGMDVTIGIDDVVAVFVARFEQNLITKKNSLSDSIRSIKAELVSIEKQVDATVVRTDYEVSVAIINLKSKVNGVRVVWEPSHRAEHPCILVLLSLSEIKGTWGSMKEIELPIPDKLLQDYKVQSDNLERTQAELMSVVLELKSISTKERAVRGRIAEMRLNANPSGAELLKDPTILKLIDQ